MTRSGTASQRANRTVRNLDWFQVTEIRGNLQEGQIADWQISMKVGFRLEDAIGAVVWWSYPGGRHTGTADAAAVP